MFMSKKTNTTLMSYQKLTEKEKKTIYYLVKYPTLTDQELSDKTGIKHSTITAIRRRLKDEGYYVDLRIPHLWHLGCELLTVGFGNFNRTAPSRSFKEFYKIQKKQFDNTFHFMGSREFGMFMNMARNYTEVKKDIDNFRYYLDKFGLGDNNQWDFIVFPFEISKLINFGDFSQLLKHLLRIEEEPPVIDLSYEKCKKIMLSEKEKRAYYGLIKYPSMPDNAIAKKVGISRQIFSKMHEQFEKEGLMKTVKVPLLRKLGYQILVLSVTKFNPKTPLESRKNGVRIIATQTPNFLIISSDFDNVLAGVSLSYDEYIAMKNRILDFYKKQKFIKEEPRIFLVSLDEVEYVKHDYAPLVKKILWTEGAPKEIEKLNH